VQYLPMIGGFRKRAADHGWLIQTRVVYANDRYEVELGLDEKLVHVPASTGSPRGERVAAYAVAVHRDGRRMFEAMTAEDVERARKASRSATKGPWVDWTDRMWEKTPGRRLFAKLPLAGDDADRIASLIANSADENEPAPAAMMMYGPRAAPPTLEPPRRLNEGSEVSPEGADGTQPEGEAGEAAVSRPSPPAAFTPEQIDAAKDAEGVVVSVPNAGSWVNGKTLHEIAALGADGDVFFRWALRNDLSDEEDITVELKDAVRAYTRVVRPELYAEATS